jgi:hypothetical protein
VTQPFLPGASSGNSNSNSNSGGGNGGSALTKLAWSPEGRKLAVGDAGGVVHVLGVDAPLVTPRADEAVRLEEALLLRGGSGGGDERSGTAE